MGKSKQKLIKLSESHYIVVDDSEIKHGEWCLDVESNEFYVSKGNVPSNKYVLKITHSFGKHLEGVENRPLSEVEELIYNQTIESKLDALEQATNA